MKTPNEIKKGLELCSIGGMEKCMQCPYPIGFECFEQPMKDALTYIRQLEETIDNMGHLNVTMRDEAKKGIQELESRLAQAERERDAAIKDIPRACGYCKHCQYAGGIPFCFKKDCTNISGINTGFEWRSVCGENTKEE